MRWTGMIRILIAVLLTSFASGCVKIANDHYTINGHDVSTLVGQTGFGKTLIEGSTAAAEVHQTLGNPAFKHGDAGTTEIYVAPVGYRWIFSPWPVVLAKQAGFGDAPMLLRIDYDDNHIIRGFDTKRMYGGAERRSLADDVRSVYPDLR